MASEPEWRQLHPASLAVNLVPHLWRTARGAWPLLLAVVVGTGLDNLLNLLIVMAFFAIAVGRTVVHFATLRYRVNDGKLELRGGLISQSFRVIDASRIQNLEIVQNVFHKAAGLVELRIETAGESGAEGLLSAISVEEARKLQAALSRRVATEAPAATVQELGVVEILGYGMSAGRVGAAAVVVGLLLDASAQFSPQAVQAATKQLGGASLIGLVLLALAGGYAVSVANAVLRFSGYRLFQTGTGLATEAGLFTRRRVEIPARKVQLLRVQEPLVRRLMGYATVNIETAASGLPPEMDGQLAEGIVPMVHAEERLEIARLALPALDVDPWTVGLRTPARRALVPALVAATVRWSLLATAIGIVVGSPWVFLLVAWGWASATLDWRWQGWLVTEKFIVARTGFLRRDTWLLPREKIQSVRRVAGPVAQACGLARVVVWVPGGRVGLPDIAAAEAEGVFAGLTSPARVVTQVR